MRPTGQASQRGFRLTPAARHRAGLTIAAVAVSGVVALSSVYAGSVQSDEMTEGRGDAPITEGAEIYLGACDSCHGVPRAQGRRDSSAPASAGSRSDHRTANPISAAATKNAFRKSLTTSSLPDRAV